MFRIGYYHSLTPQDYFVPLRFQPAKVKTFSVMSFLNPLFLAALVTVAIPLLIYLLNLRKPKRVRFSTLAFFDSLKSTALKRIKLKRWLLLSLRMLAVAALVMAASRPFLSPGSGAASGNEQEPKAIAILIDNSPAMAQIDRNGPLIDQAKTIAAEVVRMADSEDRITLEVTHGESINAPFFGKGGVTARLNGLEPVTGGGFTYERMNRLINRLENAGEPNKILYLVSAVRESHLNDFSQTTADIEASEVRLQVIKIGSEGGSNAGFSSIVIEDGGAEPGANIRIRSVVENFGEQGISNLFLSLYMDGELIVQQPVSLNGFESDEFVFEMPPSGSAVLEAELRIDGDELTYDNRYFLTIQKPETKKLLVISGQNETGENRSYLMPVFELLAEESDRFEVVLYAGTEPDVTELREYDAVILDGPENVSDYLSAAIIDHVQQGAGLLFLPAADGNLNSYNRFLEGLGAGRFSNVTGSYGSFRSIDRMAAPEAGHPLIESIFDAAQSDEIRLNVPELYYYFEMEGDGRSVSIPVLRTENGSPLLNEFKTGNGRVIISSIGSDPGWSNFPIKPFFAPFFYRTAEYLVQGGGAVLNNHTLGEPFSITLPVSEASDEVVLIKDGEQIIPEVRQTFRGSEVAYRGAEWGPGRLSVEFQDAEPFYHYSVNLDAIESRLYSLSIDETEQIFRNRFADVRVIEPQPGLNSVTNNLETASFGKEIWFWFITAAIILLLTESLVSRLLKAESIA